MRLLYRAYVFCLCCSTAPAWGGEITVATLNIGHGRGDEGHQIFLSESAIQENLLHIGNIAQELSVDVLALQEADVHAWWSGYNNQIQTIGGMTELIYSIEGIHSQRSSLLYGTSLLSKSDWTQKKSLGYKSTFVLPQKGFVYGVMVVEEQPLLIVSIHLDPLRHVVREKQIEILASVVNSYALPTIIMGDLNIEWGAELQKYCQLLHVVPYQPDADLITFASLDKRLDWILLSEQMRFLRYQTLESSISDHRMVVATIAMPISK